MRYRNRIDAGRELARHLTRYAALREQQPSGIIVAAPVGAAEACARLATLADDVVCPSRPDPFSAVGLWYDDFDPTADDEVCRLLEKPDFNRNAPAVQ